jgi:hypothetical protein
VIPQIEQTMVELTVLVSPVRQIASVARSLYHEALRAVLYDEARRRRRQEFRSRQIHEVRDFLERFPVTWNHVTDKKSLQFKTGGH